jgi:hypothetical protein
MSIAFARWETVLPNGSVHDPGRLRNVRNIASEDDLPTCAAHLPNHARRQGTLA